VRALQAASSPPSAPNIESCKIEGLVRALQAASSPPSAPKFIERRST